MKLAYVTVFDATDVRNWSGLDLHIWKSLAAQGAEVELVGTLKHGQSVPRRLRKLWGTKVEHKVFSPLWEVDTAKGYAQDAAQRIAGMNVDAILSPNPVPLAYLERKEPIFLWTDATFSALLDFYPEFSRDRLSSASVKSGLAIDQASLSRCTLAIYSSDWAAQRAIRDHGVPPEKVAVVPFGANVEDENDLGGIKGMIDRRSPDCLRLLFIGVDWERKGGATALAAAQALHDRGVEVELTVVGCEPGDGAPIPPFVRSLGFVSKSTAEGKATLKRLFQESHAILLPTRAECCPVVLAEAHAFGMPCASTQVGGIATIVQDGITGRLFNLNDSPELWADWLQGLVNDRRAYREMALAAFDRYQRHLNWRVAGAAVRDLIRQHTPA